jgi:hypothetical protein
VETGVVLRIDMIGTTEEMTERYPLGVTAIEAATAIEMTSIVAIATEVLLAMLLL